MTPGAATPADPERTRPVSSGPVAPDQTLVPAAAAPAADAFEGRVGEDEPEPEPETVDAA